jgi:hypothetical protein
MTGWGVKATNQHGRSRIFHDVVGEVICKIPFGNGDSNQSVMGREEDVTSEKSFGWTFETVPARRVKLTPLHGSANENTTR